MLDDEYRAIFFQNDAFAEEQMAPLYRTEFISHFPKLKITKRPKKLKNKIIRAAPYANI